MGPSRKRYVFRKLFFTQIGGDDFPSPEGIEIAERTRILQTTMKNKLINMTRQFYNSIKICLITPKNKLK